MYFINLGPSPLSELYFILLSLVVDWMYIFVKSSPSKKKIFVKANLHFTLDTLYAKN